VLIINVIGVIGPKFYFELNYSYVAMVVPPIIAFVDRHRARFLVVIIFLFPILGYFGDLSARRLVGKGGEVGIWHLQPAG
jgi:hypothetical protein